MLFPYTTHFRSPPTKAMREEIVAAGKYRHPLLNREDDRIQIITVEDILAGKRLDLPMARTDAVKSATALDMDRSEEHTSELQSLMSLSYAVFCLKKKNIK